MLHNNPAEDQTQKDIIDGLLEKAGWNINDYSKVIEEFEIDSLRILSERLCQSIFNTIFFGKLVSQSNKHSSLGEHYYA